MTTSPTLLRSSPASSGPTIAEVMVPGRGAAMPTWIRSVLDGLPAGRELVILRPGELIPGTRYRIIRWRGEGGMGVVYEAEHVDLERRAAVKILRPEVCHKPEVVRAFRDEARAASRIGSELIVKLYDFTELSDQRLMIGMELLEGDTLHHYLAEPMEPARALGILRQVCKALAAAHEVGVVHRDIKPENVFLTVKDGRADAVKLVDFGIAAIHDGIQFTAIRGGTPYYLAPEVTTSGSVERSVDVYAFGVLAFEMLTGELPFDHDDLSEVLRAHLEDPPPAPSSRRASVPAALDAVVLRCLDKDPSTRPQDMVEVEAQLCEAQLECGLQTAWDDLLLPAVEPDRRDRLLALLPVAAGPSPRRRSVLVVGLAVAGLLAAGAVVGNVMVGDTDPVEQGEASSWVEERGVEAREAAARALFVYPPVEQPRRATAYSVVQTLEGREGDDRRAALAAAEELREQFATTLGRLGNEYWDKEGGRPFAAAYYEQALLFDPDDERARQRSQVSAADLEALAVRAAALAFSEPELLGSEPLVVLAASDPKSRKEQLVALRDKRRRRAERLERQLATLGGLDPGEPDVETASPSKEPATAPSRPQRQPDPGSASGEGGEEDAVAVEPDEAPARDRDADREQAAMLAKKGQAALAGGRLEPATELFEQALGRDRRNAAALAGMRDVAFERGHYSRAVSFGERVIRMRANDAGHRLALGDAYLKVLRYRDALAQYERAQALGESRADWRVAKLRKQLGPG